MKTICIISALVAETEYVIKEMKDVKKTSLGIFSFFEGTISNYRIIVTNKAYGKVNSALCSQYMIDAYHPDFLINTGVAGALTDSLKIYDIVVADSLCQHDVDSSPIGDPKGMISGIYKTFIDTDKHLREVIIEGIKNIGENAVNGIIATGDQFIADRSLKENIHNEFNAVACDMESGSIGQVAFINNVPYCAIRMMSDSLSQESHVEYSEFASNAAHKLSCLLIDVIKSNTI